MISFTFISQPFVARTYHPPFSNFLFTNLFSIKFLYFFIISSLFPYFNLFVSIFIQSYVNIKLQVSTLQILIIHKACNWTGLTIAGADPGFQVRGGALIKIAPNGGRRENCWCISCEKSRFYDKKIIFFPILGGARTGCAPRPGSTPESYPCSLRVHLLHLISIMSFKLGHVSIPKRRIFLPLFLFCAYDNSVLQNFKIFTHLLPNFSYKDPRQTEVTYHCINFNDRVRKVPKIYITEIFTDESFSFCWRCFTNKMV